MKQLFLVLSLFSNICCAKGQSISELDKRNGFKTVKISDKFSKYQTNTTLLSTDSKTAVSIYDFTPADEDLFYVFDLKMDQILLTFDKDRKLVSILLHKFFKGTNSMHEAIEVNKQLDDKFIALFGKASAKIDISTTDVMHLGLFWGGLKINLKSYIEDYGIYKGTDIKVVLTDNSFATNSFNSGF